MNTRFYEWIRTGLAASSVLAIAVALSACGGKEPRRSAGLGESQTRQDETTVTTRREVTRVISSKSDLPTVRTSTVRADVNRMEPKHFQALGFPADISKRIVEYRDDKGAFKSVEELRRVEGLSEDVYNQHKDKLGVGRAD